MGVYRPYPTAETVVAPEGMVPLSQKISQKKSLKHKEDAASNLWNNTLPNQPIQKPNPAKQKKYLDSAKAATHSTASSENRVIKNSGLKEKKHLTGLVKHASCGGKTSAASKDSRKNKLHTGGRAQAKDKVTVLKYVKAAPGARRGCSEKGLREKMHQK